MRQGFHIFVPYMEAAVGEGGGGESGPPRPFFFLEARVWGAFSCVVVRNETVKTVTSARTSRNGAVTRNDLVSVVQIAEG